jgi:hypothetical protein
MRPRLIIYALAAAYAALGFFLFGCKPAPAVASEPTPHPPAVAPATPKPTPLPAPLVTSPANPSRITGPGRKLIYEFEVGGGEAYYTKFLSRPTVPPEASGVTVGIGYDLGYNTKAQILRAWQRLPSGQAERLATAAGLKQGRARAILPTLRDIQVRWGDAEAVFNETTLTDFLDIADNAYPGMQALHPDAQAVLVSIVFNRGGSMAGERRREMRNIRALVPKEDYRGMAREIRAMKRLWPNTRGLLRRRDAEAALMDSCAD